MSIDNQFAVAFVLVAVIFTIIGWAGCYWWRKETPKEFDWEALPPHLQPPPPGIAERHFGRIILPQRMPKSKTMPTWLKARANGWNQAIEEVKRLNP